MDKIKDIIIIVLLVAILGMGIATCAGVFSLDGVYIEPSPTVQPTVEPTVQPTIEPTIQPTPIPTVEPTPTPVIVIPSEDLPPMASIGFDLNQDVSSALPLYVNNKDIIALKMPKIDGWIWKIASAKNVSMVMPYPEHFIVVCSLSNTETYVNFEMVNENDIIGMTIYVTFAVAIGE